MSSMQPQHEWGAIPPLGWEAAPRLSSDSVLDAGPGSKEAAEQVQTLMRIDRGASSTRAQDDARSTVAQSSSTLSMLLRSHAVKGVGPKLSTALLQRFGDRTLEVLQGADAENEMALRQLPGMGEKTLAKIRESVHQWEGLRAAIEFARGLGCLSQAQISTLASRYGEQTEQVVRSNPYLLLDLFPELRFGAVDTLARSILDVTPDAAERARAALCHCMKRARNNGHCCVPRERLRAGAAAALRLDELTAERALAASEQAIVDLTAKGVIVLERPPPARLGMQRSDEMVSLASMQAAERHVADAVRRRLAPSEQGHDPVFGRYADWMTTRADPPPTHRDIVSGDGDDGDRDMVISSLADEEPLAQANHAKQPLSRAQCDAVARASFGKLMVLTGGPGTGKTFTVRAIVDRWRAEGKRVLLACPTARAASVLAAAAGGEASTIHRLLEWNPRENSFGRAANNPLETDAVVIDEASMLDVHLAGALFHALPPAANILIVGDDDQLPSVGPGAVLHDLLRCSRVPRVELREIFRQDPSGDIALNAQQINSGTVPQHMRVFDSVAALERAAASTNALRQKPAGCVLISAFTEQTAAEAICGGVLSWLERGGYDLSDDVQVLTPLKRGAAGTFALNHHLQERLNPEVAAAKATAEPNSRGDLQPGAPVGRRDPGTFESVPRVGDTMIQLTNDYTQQVFNGDIGHVTRVWKEGNRLRFSVAFSVRTAGAPGGAASTSRLRRTGATRGVTEPQLLVEYTRSALGRDVALSYALTVHKAQGSEYPVVVMPILPQHSSMLYRNLLYTGLSRAKQLLVLVGSEAALRKAVENDTRARRVTLLAERVDDRNFASPLTRHMSEA